MNRVLFAAGLLSTGLALGQTTGSTSTTSTSNYNTTNTNNENSRNATMGTNSSTDRPSSMSGNAGRRRGNNSGMQSTTTTSGSSTTSYNSTGSDSNNTGMTTTGTTNTGMAGSANTDNTTTTTTGSGNMNSAGAGSSMTTPSTMNGTGSSVTTNSTYSTSTSTSSARPYQTKDYKNFAYGIYAGLNATNLRGESVNTENPSSRLGYQLGLFVRGGGRLYGQIGAEYFASSSNYYRAGNASSPQAVRDYINVQYIQVPVYIGYKLTESDRGISAIRVQVGAEYANRISSDSRTFNLSAAEIKTGSFNALGQLGFDFGPFLIDLTYHHGLSDALQINTFQASQRRILSASFGFKF